MRRGLSVGAVLMFWWVLGRCHAGAIEYLDGPVFSGMTGVMTTEWPVRLSVDPQGKGVWVLGAELRDATCPTCQFPDFLLPKDFYCIECPCCTTASLWFPFWAVSAASANNAVRAVLSNNQSVRWMYLYTLSLTLWQGTTSTPVSCSQELNVFLYQESVVPEDFQLSTLRGLAGLRGLTARFYHRVEQVSQAQTCPRPLAVAATLVGIKFWNPFTHTVFNYQIVTFDSRGMEFDGGWWRFAAGSGETVYGVSDSLGVYQMGSLPTEGDALSMSRGRIFSVNVLARVKALIRANPFGLEADPRRWLVKGFYSGTTTNGHAYIESTQGFFGLEGY